MQVKDPSKAAHASDEDLKDLIKFRGEELKKGPLEGAKCDKKRHEQVEHQLQSSVVPASGVTLRSNCWQLAERKLKKGGT